MTKRRISQQQIAQDLGLSQTLVSMVLNGRKKGVSEKSFQQIWSHAKRSGYRPKGMAIDSLPEADKSSSVGFILRAGAKLYSQSPFFGHVQHGLQDYLAERGIALEFLGIENSLDAEILARHYANRQTMKGVVVLGEVARPFLQALRKIEPQIVAVSAQYPGLCHSVVSNEEQSAELLVQHLLDLGHTRFAWLGGDNALQRSKSRFNALTSALRLHDLQIETAYQVNLPSAERIDGREAAEKILTATSNSTAPTAWICFNGTMARGAANYLLQQGISIPGDISIAAFDRTRISEEESPTITGANTLPELIGRVAAEVLIGKEEASEASFCDTVLRSELVVRESTGKVSKKKTLVKAA
jgi:LacI family transcriptional regulator